MNAEVRNIYRQPIFPEQTDFSSHNEISFLIDGREAWTDLSNLEVEVSLSMRKRNNATHDVTNYAAGEAFPNAFPENNIFHSLWERCEVEIAGNPTNSQGNYSMKAYMKAVATYDDAEAMLMNMEGFYPTGKEEKVEAGPTMQMTGTGDNRQRVNDQDHVHKSVKKRQSDFGGGNPSVSFYGRLRGDLLDQSKHLIPGVPFRVRLIRNKPAFNCRAGDTTTHTPFLSIDKIQLFVTRTVLQDVMEASYRKALHARELASYPIRRETLTHQILPSGTNIVINRLVSGPIPRRIILGFVDNKSLTGDFKRNPFYFEHLKIEEIYLNFDGKEYPSRRYADLDFTSEERCRKNIRAYNEVLRVIGDDNSDSIPYLTYHRWLNGHTLFAFDLTPDQSAATGNFYKTVRRAGDITLELRLHEEPMDENNRKRSVSVLVFSEFDSCIDLRIPDYQPILDW